MRWVLTALRPIRAPITYRLSHSFTFFSAYYWHFHFQKIFSVLCGRERHQVLRSKLYHTMNWVENSLKKEFNDIFKPIPQCFVCICFIVFDSKSIFPMMKTQKWSFLLHWQIISIDWAKKNTQPYTYSGGYFSILKCLPLHNAHRNAFHSMIFTLIIGFWCKHMRWKIDIFFCQPFDMMFLVIKTNLLCFRSAASLFHDEKLIT